MKKPQEATYILLKAKSGKEKELSDFLNTGAGIVKKTEPSTLLWFALQLDGSTFAIIDFFPDEAGRSQHFSGKVAEALEKNAPDLVEGGWNKGVLNNIENSKVLKAVVSSKEQASVKEATLIHLKAKRGKESDLAHFLKEGGKLVEETEPNTLYWFALQLDESRFAIFDLFPDEAGRSQHFAGKVAQALQEKSSELVEGGWEQGVLKNVKNYHVLAATTAAI
ncbi:MAG: hypothetical protein WAM28_03985 [Chlamydiales bacterium]